MGRSLALQSGSRLKAFQVFPPDENELKEKDSVELDLIDLATVSSTLLLSPATFVNNTCINVHNRDWS